MQGVRKMNKYKLSPIGAFWYYIACICSLGGLYFIKLAVKKALIEEKIMEPDTFTYNSHMVLKTLIVIGSVIDVVLIYFAVRAIIGALKFL